MCIRTEVSKVRAPNRRHAEKTAHSTALRMSLTTKPNPNQTQSKTRTRTKSKWMFIFKQRRPEKKIRVCTSPANRMRRSNQTGKTRTQLKSQGHKTRTRASRALHYSGGSIPRKKRPNPIFCCLCFWRHFSLTDALVTAASRGRCPARYSCFFRASPRRVLPH